jgi:hypothetical protein
VTDARDERLKAPLLLADPGEHEGHRAPRTLRLLVETRDGLQRRLQVLAQDVDEFWRESLECGDFKLVTSSVEASHAVHLAIAALDVDRYVAGASTGGPRQ